MEEEEEEKSQFDWDENCQRSRIKEISDEDL